MKLDKYYNQSKILKEFFIDGQSIIFQQNISDIDHPYGIRIKTHASFDENHIFKVYRMKIINLNTDKQYFTYEGCARISMLEPRYIECEYENSYLSKYELNIMIQALNLPSDYESNITGWKYLIKETNRIYEIENYPKRIPLDLPMPDYSLLPTCD